MIPLDRVELCIDPHAVPSDADRGDPEPLGTQKGARVAVHALQRSAPVLGARRSQRRGAAAGRLDQPLRQLQGVGRDGDAVIILLGGGTKKRQQSDIETARDLWREYSRRKRQETG